MYQLLEVMSGCNMPYSLKTATICNLYLFICYMVVLLLTKDMMRQDFVLNHYLYEYYFLEYCELTIMT